MLNSLIGTISSRTLWNVQFWPSDRERQLLLLPCRLLLLPQILLLVVSEAAPETGSNRFSHPVPSLLVPLLVEAESQIV